MPVRIFVKSEVLSMTESPTFYFVGNNLAIDFVNTKVASNGSPLELLQQAGDLAAWASSAGLISEREAGGRMKEWNERGAVVLREAVKFRTVIHELLVRLAAGSRVDDSTIKVINDHLKMKNGNTEIVRSESGFEKILRADFADPKQILAAVAESLADLLAYGDLELIKKCENPDCVLYFYDTTKNHNRRWCSMAACGNRAKAKAFYQRMKASKGGEKTSDAFE